MYLFPPSLSCFFAVTNIHFTLYIHSFVWCILYWISCLGLTPHKPVIATDDQVDWILMSHLFQCQSKIKSRERLPRILSNLHLIHCIHQDFTNPIRKSPRSQRLCLICSSIFPWLASHTCCVCCEQSAVKLRTGTLNPHKLSWTSVKWEPHEKATWKIFIGLVFYESNAHCHTEQA